MCDQAINRLKPVLVCLMLALLAACTATPVQPAPSAVIRTPVPTLDPLYRSKGGGDPRGAGYWLVWNTCVKGNQAAAAKANGGRLAGWILLDDLLADPGILMGQLEVKTCDQAAAILQGKPHEAANQDSGSFYRFASELLAAQLNLAVPAETCPAVEQAVLASQLLLVSMDYQGNASTLASKDPEKGLQLAEFLAGQLEQYNKGELCR